MAINLNTEIKVYSMHIMAEDIYKNINDLTKDCIQNNTLPYLNDSPLPQDMNIVNGRHLGDINKIQLELKAGQIGAKSLKWIYGADAALMGLELKTPENSSSEYQVAKNNSRMFNTDPIIGLANVRRDVSLSTSNVNNESNILHEGIQMEAQTIYLLDQFTERSVQRALNPIRIEESLELRGNEESRRHKKIIAQNMLKNIAEYDSGIKGASLREVKRSNLKKNFSRDSSIAESVRDNHQKLTKGYDNFQKQVFAALNAYYVRQETGIQMGKELNPAQKQMLTIALQELSKNDSPRLAQTLCDTFFFAERSTHYEFSHERIYSQMDLNNRLSVLAPKAARFEERNVDSLVADRTKEKLKEREREFKPRQITHQRGM